MTEHWVNNVYIFFAIFVNKWRDATHQQNSFDSLAEKYFCIYNIGDLLRSIFSRFHKEDRMSSVYLIIWISQQYANYSNLPSSKLA